MQYRQFGNTHLTVSEIGYGAWGIGGKQWKGGDDSESSRALRRAFDLGLNFVDTALAYGDGHSERLIAGALREAPGPVFTATKVPPKNRVWPAPANIDIRKVFPSDYIIQCTEQSLKNLGIERIDLQQLHVWDPGWLQQDEWRNALATLRESGKVRYFGVSINDHQPGTALDLIRSREVDSVQVIYNIFDQSPESELLPLARQLGVAVIARVPFDEGSLTGSIREDSSFENDEFRAFYFRGNRKREVRERVERLQADTDASGPLPEVALRFCLSQPAVSTVIPGMRSIRNVEANCAVSGKGPLPSETLEKLRNHAWRKNYYQ